MSKILCVSASASATAEPDLITLSVSLSAKDKEYSAVTQLAAQQHDELVRALAKIGFAEKEIKVSDFSVNTEYEYLNDEKGRSRREFVGYICSQSLNVKFPLDMSQLAETVKAVSGCAAAPEFSIAFSKKDTSKLADEAARRAVSAAKAKAKLLADAFGVKLGGVSKVSYHCGEAEEVSPTNFALTRMCANDKASLASMTPSDVSVTETVNCEFDFD